MGQAQGNDWPEAVNLVGHNSLALRNDVIRLTLGRFETEASGANRSAMIDNLMEWATSVLWYKVGAAGGSAHGGASPPADSAGSGSSPARRPVSPRVDDSSAPRSSSVVSASTGIAPRFCVSTSLPGSRRFVRWNECRSSTRLRALVPATFLSGFFSPSLRPVLFHLCSPWIRLRFRSPSFRPVLSPFADALAVWLAGTVVFSSLARCGCVFPSFPLCFLPLS